MVRVNKHDNHRDKGSLDTYQTECVTIENYDVPSAAATCVERGREGERERNREKQRKTERDHVGAVARKGEIYFKANNFIVQESMRFDIITLPFENNWNKCQRSQRWKSSI